MWKFLTQKNFWRKSCVCGGAPEGNCSIRLWKVLFIHPLLVSPPTRATPTHFPKHFFVFLFSATLHPEILSLTFPFVAFAMSTLGAFHLVSSSVEPMVSCWLVGAVLPGGSKKGGQNIPHPLALSSHLLLPISSTSLPPQ